MANTEMNRLLTVTDCDTALKQASRVIRKLADKRDRLEHRMEVHQMIAAKATEEISRLKWELSILNQEMSRIEEGRRARECRCRINLTTGRMQQLELRLEDYSMPALAMKEFDLNLAAAALEHAEQFRAELELRRAQLLQEEAAAQPDAPVEPETAAMIPLPQPAAGLKPVARPEPVVRLLPKQKRKRLKEAKRANGGAAEMPHYGTA